MATASRAPLKVVAPPAPPEPLRSAWRGVAAFALALAALVALTRLPIAPVHLFSFDNVNLALALERFDPRLHQPQPPGYPLFVAQARLFNFVLRNPETTFLLCGLLAGVAAPLLLLLLGARMQSQWAGMAAALLLALNPVFWRGTVTSPLRPYLAVVSVGVAYLCHRAAAGETRFVYFSALALGLGGGWRPALMVLLFPLWIFCAWRGLQPGANAPGRLRSPRKIALGLLLAGAAALTWVTPLVVVAGGPGQLWVQLSQYLGENSEASSPLFGSDFWGWWKMFTQAFVWHALAVVGWAWAALLLVRRRRAAAGDSDPRTVVPHWLFISLWIGPSVLFFVFIHVASPGHTLSVIPALCLLGGLLLDRAAARAALFTSSTYSPRWAFLAASLAINIGFFLFPFRIPHARPQIRGTPALVREQFRFWGAFALREASYVDLREESMRTADRIHLLRGLGRNPGLVIVWQDDDVSWRKITYYFASRPTWVIEGVSGPNRAGAPSPRLWHGNRIVKAEPGLKPGPLELPPNGRVAWLLHLHSPFPDELRAQGVPLRQFGALFLTDLSAAPARFRAGAFSFQQQPSPHLSGGQ